MFACRTLNAAMLKRIAVVTMLIDHIGACVLTRVLIFGGLSKNAYTVCYDIYNILRLLGRTAFPIFCFFLVEGFFKTRSRCKYMMRLGIFALLSEIPFDLATQGVRFIKPQRFAMYTWNAQNVMFTLLIGLLAIWGMDRVRKMVNIPDKAARIAVMALGCALIGAVALLLGKYGRVDYGLYGVLTIIVIYLFNDNPVLKCLLGYCALFAIDANCLLGFLLLLLYDGEKGKQNKYFFYAFYPVHFIVLFTIALLITEKIL